MSNVLSSDLPVSWATATLTELIGQGGVFNDGDWVESKDQDPAGEVRLTQLADVGVGRFLDRSSRYLTNDAAARLRCTFLETGDVLVARMPDPLGRACIFPGSPMPCVTVVDVCIVRPSKQNVDPRWLMWTINAPQFQAQVDALQSGTTRRRISRKNLATIPLPIPPLTEQRRIVAEIETQFTRLDAAVAALERARANLKRYRASALTSALSSQAFIESSNAPLSDSNPMTILMPATWNWSTLAEVSSLKGGITKGNRRSPGTVLRTVPYLRVANVQRGWLDLCEVKTIEATDHEIARLQLHPGDVLFNEGGDRDKLGRGWVWEGQVEECIHQNHVFRARLKPETLLPKFLSHYANTFGQPYFMREGKQTTNLASINLTKLGAFPVPIPPMDDQVRIVEEIERQLSVCGEIEATISINLKRAERMRQSILRKAFAGQLVPQYADDEPAAAVLERIRTERATQSATRGSARRRLRAAQPQLL